MYNIANLLSNQILSLVSVQKEQPGALTDKYNEIPKKYVLCSWYFSRAFKLSDCENHTVLPSRSPEFKSSEPKTLASVS